MTVNRAIMIAGPFTEEEVAELAAAMRAIERRHPENTYRLLVSNLDHETTIHEMGQVLDRIFPRVDGQPPDVTIKRRGA